MIDCSNLYHAIKDARGYPLTGDEIISIFSEIERKFDVQEFRFYDAIKDRTVEPQNYSRQQKFHAAIKNGNSKFLLRSRPLQYRQNLTEEGISAVTSAMNFCRECKQLIMPLFHNLKIIVRTREKGIDVLLATDAIEIAQTNKSSWIIFVSGDADYVPAVKLVKKYEVSTMNLHPWRGSSAELRNECDKHALIDVDSGKPIINWHDLQS